MFRMEKSGGNFDLSKIRPDPSRSHIFFPLILEHFNRNLAKVLFHLKYKMSTYIFSKVYFRIDFLCGQFDVGLFFRDFNCHRQLARLNLMFAIVLSRISN